MILYSISIVLTTSPKSSILSHSENLSSFGYFERFSTAEFLKFSSMTVAERTPPDQRQSITEGKYVCHVYKRSVPGHLAAVLITDQEYPVRPASSLLTKILEDFTAKVPESSFSDLSSISFPEIDTYLEKYQDPRQADAIMKVQQELDETKIVLHKTIESVLQRGEKLEDLVDRSNTLSSQSKAFYKVAKRQNSCCTVM